MNELVELFLSNRCSDTFAIEFRRSLELLSNFDQQSHYPELENAINLDGTVEPDSLFYIVKGIV